jgi:hypothetical protein
VVCWLVQMEDFMKKSKFTSCVALVCILSFCNIEVVNAKTEVHPINVSADWGGTLAPFTRIELEDGIKIDWRDYESRTIDRTCDITYLVWNGTHYTVHHVPKRHVTFTFRKLIITKPEPLFCMVAFAQRRRVMLQYPPAGTVWHAPGGISQLTAVLRSRGHDVMQRYGHIIGLEHLLLSQSEPDVLRSLTTVRALNPTVQEMYDARQTFERVSASISTKDRFKFERNNVVYLSQNQDGTIYGALEAIKNRENNLWYDYFNKVEIPLARDFKPHVYGISIGDERQLFPGLVLAAMVKDALPDCLVVVGGNFWPRVMVAFEQPEFAQMFNHLDAIVYREGYQPLQSLVETLDPAQATGTVWRKNGEVTVNPPTQNPTDFESLPTPEFDGGAKQWAPEFIPTLYTASGCRKRCGFCAISVMDDRFLVGKPRYMSPQKIARDMARLGVTKFDIVDELFSIEFQLELGAELKRIGHAATWQCYLTVEKELVDPKVCEQLYQAGCRSVQLGLESLDSETLFRELKAWNKPASYCRILSNLRNVGIHTHVFLMVGLPGEPIHQGFKWAGFLEECGKNILTIKSGRYRLARRSPEEQFGKHSKYIELAAASEKPLSLNRGFRYKDGQTFKTMTNTKVDAVRDIVEQACRKHWAYGVTSTIPWWINRSRYTWQELEQMATALRPELDIPHLKDRVAQMRYVVREELHRDANFQTFDEMSAFAQTLL